MQRHPIVAGEGVALKTAAESLRQGWKEAMAGETLPIEELWRGIGHEQSDIAASEIRRILGERGE
jgi:hypothetical protein